jgi:hypothetical protein
MEFPDGCVRQGISIMVEALAQNLKGIPNGGIKSPVVIGGGAFCGPVIVFVVDSCRDKKVPKYLHRSIESEISPPATPIGQTRGNQDAGYYTDFWFAVRKQAML